MIPRRVAQVDAVDRDPVCERAQAVAIEALVNHRSVIQSLAPEVRRAIVDMDPGPTHEVGVPRPSR